MALPLHELAALGTATCWATTGLISADAVRALGAFHFNLLRQVFVAVLLGGIVMLTQSWAGQSWQTVGTLAASGIVGIMIGDTLNFAAVGRIGPRRAGAVGSALRSEREGEREGTQNSAPPPPRGA